jgi:hypothetical protein
MAIVVCIIGALAGLTCALLANVFVLPRVIASLGEGQGEVWRSRMAVTMAYRYVMPLVFGSAGATAAYYVFVA